VQSGTESFLERARTEAARYGADDWVFVRELLQNARDAGARRVVFTVSEDGDEVTCDDDGEGMSQEHARRYLFTLYASSKEGAANQVGRFGVGFWSVLRFHPRVVRVASRPRDGGDAWGLALDLERHEVQTTTGPPRPGTRVALSRRRERGGVARDGWDPREPQGKARVVAKLAEAATEHARFLRTRDDPERALAIEIEGRTINASFSLPPPCVSFVRGRMRGVVGFGDEPHVELIARGLRVRSASTLDELASAADARPARGRTAELAGALAPQAILECDDLDVLLARTEARHDRHLQKLIEVAAGELGKLLDRQIGRARREPFFRRASAWLGQAARRLFPSRHGLWLAVVAVAVVWTLAWKMGRDRRAGRPPQRGDVTVVREAPPYDDLAHRYDGPEVELSSGADPTTPAAALAYEPRAANPRFAALLFDELGDGGVPTRSFAEEAAFVPEARCTRGCVTVTLAAATAAGTLHLPTPTGHTFIASSLRIEGEGRERPLVTSSDGLPALTFARPFEGTIVYETGPTTTRAAVPLARTSARAGRAADVLPRDLFRLAHHLRGRPVGERVKRLEALVRQRVRYDRGPTTARRHEAARAAGQGPLARALAIGAGDCDVINGLYLALLHAAEVPSRLAVGYVGAGGRVRPWLHAWIEFRDGREGAAWRMADASNLPGEPDATSAFSGSEIAREHPPVAGLGEPTEDPGESSGEPAATPTRTDRADTDLADADLADLDVVGSALSGETAGTGAESLRPAAHGRSAPGSGRWLAGAAAALLVAVAALLAFLLRGRRTIRRTRIDDTQDLAALVEGALKQPEAFRHMPAVFQRRLVDAGAGATVSLSRARELATQGRLFRSGAPHEGLAARARRRGLLVLDDRERSARLAADAFGAIDLDRWHSWMNAAVRVPVLERTAALLDQVPGLRRRVSLLQCRGLGAPLRTLDVAALGGLHDFPGVRLLVLVDEATPVLRAASAGFAMRPNAAVFKVLDHVADRLGLTRARRNRVLGLGARAALAEAARS
jgi:transglutaminase-like putative cysteine protease